jgi:dinuclear metal center YbgI/SA1388 family protein
VENPPFAGEPVELESIVQFLDSSLGIPGHPDYPQALNGLQVESRGPIRRVAGAVDASEEAIAAAIDRGVDLLLVHHGLFWDGLLPVTGRRFRKISTLLEANTALYSAHLPLDSHKEYGNAIQLMRALDLVPQDGFGEYQGVEIGLEATTSGTREEWREKIAGRVGGEVRLVPGGARDVTRIAVVTGAGAGFIRAAAEAGIDSLLTGEGAHHTAIDAMEFGVNVFYAGHYATETWGVRALAEGVGEAFDLPWEFIDLPLGF